MSKITLRAALTAGLAVAAVVGVWGGACSEVSKPLANILATPTAITFVDTVGFANPAPQSVAVSADGGESVTGLTATVTYPSGGNVNWLSASLSDTMTPATLTLTSNMAGLDPNSYQATVTIAARAGAKSTDIPVTVQHSPPPPTPAIAFTPASITFADTATTADPASQTIAISGAAPGTLTGLKTTVTYGSGAAGWLTATLSDTTAPATLTVKAKIAGMNAATYRATIALSATGSPNSPQEIPVALTLAFPPPPPPPPGQTVTVVLAGNLGSCGGELARQSAQVIADAHPDYVFVLGNNIPRPSQGNLTTLDDYMQCYDPTWGQFKSKTYATLGDHEVDITTHAPDFGSGMAPGADAYFGADAVGPAGKNWHSFNLGSWHVVALNVQTPGGYKRPNSICYHAGCEQLNWLSNDLSANSNKKCTLAVWYEAMWYSASKVDPNWNGPKDGYRVQDVRGVWTVLYDKNADVVVNGWPYVYERFAPMRYANGYQHPTETEWAADSARGLRQFTSGLAGDGPLSVDSAVIRLPTSEYRSGGNGFLKLVLGDGSYTWEFLNTKYSNIHDSGTGYCH